MRKELGVDCLGVWYKCLAALVGGKLHLRNRNISNRCREVITTLPEGTNDVEQADNPFCVIVRLDDDSRAFLLISSWSDPYDITVPAVFLTAWRG